MNGKLNTRDEVKPVRGQPTKEEKNDIQYQILLQNEVNAKKAAKALQLQGHSYDTLSGSLIARSA